MSNNTIRETIDAVIRTEIGSVPTGYGRVVEAVKVAVEGLAEQAADSIRESASGVASPEQVETALVAAGLVEPEPVVEDAPTPEDPQRDARISAIESNVAGLTEAVKRLTDLAERHLGRL